MKKNILFLATGYEGWKGGLYYVKNMLYGLLQYEETNNSCNIYVLVEQYDKDIFDEYEKNYDNVKVVINNASCFSRIKKKIRKMVYKQVLGKSIVWDLSDGIMEKYKIDVVFPLLQIDDKYVSKAICWIPDFQYLHYPEFFTTEELEYRKSTYLEIAKKHYNLVLSSQDAYNDYMSEYGEYGNHIHVIPFVSAIDDIEVSDEQFRAVCEKYGLPEQYFLVSNQFWQHKNHETVFKAINFIKKKHGINVVVACTGLLENARNPEYANKLLDYIEKNDLQNNIKILGLISRQEQLQLMKKCIAVVQPSLFEGWGTVVEDAKTLNKRIIMSDLMVHEEQKTQFCTMFSKFDEEELAAIMIAELTKAQSDEEKVYKVNEQARIYGKYFYEMLFGE